MKVKKNLIKYRNPSTGQFESIPAVVGGDSDIEEDIKELHEDLAQLKQQSIIIVQNGSTLTFDNGGDE